MDPLNKNDETKAELAHTPINAGLVVLQWLTYAFWGWTVLALSVLTSMVVANILNDGYNGEGVAYAIAAVLVLLPISYVCDRFYSKREPARKTGPETLVMVIHAVLFALFGIGSLIFAVFSIVSLLTSSSESQGTVTTLVCGLIIAVYYGLTFLRTLNPGKLGWIKGKYKYIMLVSVGTIVVLGIVGPVAEERSTRDDKLIVSGLPSIGESVQTYVTNKKELPASLQDIELKGDAKTLVNRNLVTYKPGKVITDSDDYPSLNTKPTNKSFGYELCVNFKKTSNNYDNTTVSRYADKGGYSAYIYAYDHPAGEVCYKVKTDG